MALSSSPFALYYPHTEIRDQNWLKAALLYWDGGVRRIVPEGYAPPDAPAVLEASNDELVKNVSPADYLNEATVLFDERLDAMLHETSAEASAPHGEYVDVRSDAYEPDTSSAASALTLDAMHWEKMSPALRDQLLQCRQLLRPRIN